MKKQLIVLLVSILLCMNCISAFSLENNFNIKQINEEKTFRELTSFEQESIIKLIDNKKDIVLKINKLNYNNPILFEKITGKSYKVDLWDEFYTLGSIELTLQEKKGSLIYQNVLYSKNIIKADLEDKKEYYYDIKINCDDGTTILYFGEVYDDEDGYKVANILYRDQDNYNISLQNNDEEIQEQDVVMKHINYEEFIVPMAISPKTVYESEPNNSTSYANVIENNDNVYGTMYGDRVDYYKVEFKRDGKANFWIGDIPYQTPHYLYVYKGSESSYNLIGSSELSGSQQLIQEKEVKKGTIYYIKVVCPGTVQIPTGKNYKLRTKLIAQLTWPGPTSPSIPSTINACYNCPEYKDETGVKHDHYGIDIAGSTGNSIFSILDGKVYDVSSDSQSGNYIWIDHIDNPVSSSTGTYLRSFYCHMRYKSSYNSGNLVWSGTNIGQVGSTGVVTGPHLHFGAYYSNNGSSYYRFNPLKLWGRSFTCGCCGNRVSSNNIINEQNNFDVKINENTSISQISNFLSRERNIGILINETFIDIDTLLSMPEIDIKRFGLKKSDVEKLSYMIKSDTDYDTYFDKLNSMSL